MKNWFNVTLWDLLLTGKKKPRAAKRQPRAATLAVSRRLPTSGRTSTSGKPSMQDRYDAIVEEMKSTYGVRIRRWRKSSSGVAWAIRYADGRVVKLIESPYPRGPMSCAIFLHEIGHHAIGLGVYKPRCLEEYHVWVWALNLMRERGFNVTPAVEKRMERSMRYAVGKAMRRGIREVPQELRAYC